MPGIPPLFIKHDPIGLKIPVVASLPHSSMFVPPEISRCFTSRQRDWLRNTDWYLQHVYDFLPRLGITVFEATHSRYVADLNRDPNGTLYGDFWDAVIPHTNAHGEVVYETPIDIESLAHRISDFHAPYHKALSETLASLADRHGSALLLDLHSFKGPIQNDICLGDVDGTTCAPEITSAFQQALAGQDFDVVCNEVFRGGYIVRSHANTPRVHALQIELRYTNYIDCTDIDLPGAPPLDEKRIDRLRQRLRQAINNAITDLSHAGLISRFGGRA